MYAITGTSSLLPAAYQYTTEQLARPQVLSNGAVNFDMAFDLTADNRVELLPVRALVPFPPAGAPAIGILRSPAQFAQLERAPERGYVADTAQVVGIGETIVLQLNGAGCTFGEPYYAKLVVDSVLIVERRIVLRSLVNRNCGYRALTIGLPKN